MELNIFFDNGQLNKNKLRENWVKYNHIEFYNIVKKFQADNNFLDLKFSNVLYCYFNNIKTIPKCIICNINNRRFIGLKDGYNNFCSKRCASKYSLPESIKNRRKKTFTKYGVNHTSKLIFVKNKQAETNTKKYGFKSPTLNNDIRVKQESTMLLNHGVKYTGHSNLLMEKVFKTRFDKYKQSIYKTFDGLDIVDIPKEGTLKIRCNLCNNIYEIKTDFLRLRYFRYKVNTCTICNPNSSYKYTSQNEIFDFLSSYNIKIIKNNREILEGREIDIYLPDYNIAIEFNGLYWHSSLFKDKFYHLDKKIKCEKNGINLIHIWEDDWIYKKQIVKSRLLNLIHLTENKIYARKCNISYINSKKSKEFLEKNHLQGFINSSYNIALFYNDEIVSIMTFGKFRRSLGLNNGNNKWELYRFCNKINTNVVGSFDKLLKKFESDINPNLLITYLNRDWSNSNNVYSKNGFDLESTTPINYWYFNDSIKKQHRFNFRKDKLIRNGGSPNKTEKEIMMENKYYIVYDCGSFKYQKKYLK